MNFKTEEKDVYLIRATLTDGSFQYKIGVSKHPNKRLKENKTSNPNKLELLKTFHSKYPYLVETSLKNYYKISNIEGEWFDLSESQVSEFEKTCQSIESNLEIVKTSTLYS